MNDNEVKRSDRAEHILAKITDPDTKLGDLRKIAGDIGKDHRLANELWSSGLFFARQLAILIMDRKLLAEKVVDDLIIDIGRHSEKEKLQLIDWLMANQLTKDKKTVELIEGWKKSPSSLKRRTFWYYQGRLRWMGKIPAANGEELLSAIETQIEKEEPEVQWAMNFTAGWIGVYEKNYRNRCVALGKKTGLYKNKMVSRGCTPEYLPEFIAIESKKRNV